jgi:hypothetical protein
VAETPFQFFFWLGGGMKDLLIFEGGIQVKYRPMLHTENNAVTSPTGLPNIPTEDFIRRVVIRVLGDTIYWTDDGTTPSTSHGFPLEKDETLIYDGADLALFRMTSASTSDVRIIYYGI